AGHALVRRVLVESLRREADAEVPLRRQSSEAPESAWLAGQLVIRLTRRSLPMLRSVTTAQLDVAAARIHRRHPIEPVAAHIHHASALLEVLMHALDHRARVVLQVRAGDDDLVRRK